jgi:hypothetical protein
VSLGEVSVGLRAVLDSITQARALAAAAMKTALGARDAIADVTVSSRHPLVDRALADYMAAARLLQEADAAAVAAAKALADYGRIIGISLPPPQTAVLRGPSASAGQSGLPMAFRPDAALRVRPRRTKQTFGVATDAEGRSLHDGELMSGHPRHAPIDPRVGIRDPRLAAEAAVSIHLESQVAALMRQQDSPREVVLYINNAVCRGRDGGRGCHEILPGILPAGSRLTVHTVEDGRRIKTEVYEGNGSEL